MLKNDPVTMATITANSSLHQLRTSASESRNNHQRDAFISSYLNSNEEKVAESGRHVRNSLTSNRWEHLHLQVQLAEKKEEDGDIGVFEARKYFNGGMDHDSPRVANANVPARQYQYHKDEDHRALETRKSNKPHYGTPSVRSESSWNSQSKLLPNAQRISSRNRNSKIQRKSFLAGLGCKCACADDNSVDISDHNHNPTYGVVHSKGSHKNNLFKAGQDADYSVKTNKPREELLCNKDVCFKKPDLAISAVNSGLEDQLVNMKLQQKEEEKPRKSLEVFGSPILNNRRSLTFDKRLTRPSWDAAAAAAPKVEEIDIFEGNYNDTESDASSDLFEIDSLTGKTNHFLNRQTSEVASGCASPTTCYAPSEASIEWSVATASAADFSVLSDSEEQSAVATIPAKTAYTSPAGTTKASREMQRRHSSTLMGCKSHKAVRVSGDAFITFEKPNYSPLIRRRSDTLAQVTRFKTDTKMGNFGAIHGQHAYARPPLQRSYSSHVSQPLYI
ncbi:protein PHYTOCHROME KINASE SUBSTRATE 1-like [Prosopis cineraria]|uniref:protein PHYTOCHROME KINASE SUBSTRATE 1-like n=1 Tax=Prosopis cineraria TaxID=364024 RepID=UPI002410620E|nr:protein PHYTOCHROME KINASE SUBSTRATE 1-like [Prosopis cineraria]